MLADLLADMPNNLVLFRYIKKLERILFIYLVLCFHLPVSLLVDLLAFRLKVFNESLTLRKEQEKQAAAAREAKESNTAEENNEEDGTSGMENRNDGEMSECVLLLLQQVCLIIVG